MSDDSCTREADVLRAAESGTWTAELQHHADTCATCQEVRAVALALQRVVADEALLPLPDAADLWWRARLQADQEARQRALRPLDTLERAEPLVALVAIVTVLVMRGDVLAGRLFTWMAGDGGSQALQLLVPSAVMPFVIVGMVLGALVVLVGLTAVVTQD
jgi:hypothetical protein